MGEANKYVAGEWRKAHKPETLLGWVERYHRWRRSYVGAGASDLFRPLGQGNIFVRVTGNLVKALLAPVFLGLFKALLTAGNKIPFHKAWPEGFAADNRNARFSIGAHFHVRRFGKYRHGVLGKHAILSAQLSLGDI